MQKETRSVSKGRGVKDYAIESGSGILSFTCESLRFLSNQNFTPATTNEHPTNSSIVMTLEYNFDGIVGPTHNFSGLSYGNVASTSHGHSVSSPRSAALQGLEKMRTVSQLGIAQAVLPPLHRPSLDFLRRIGFTGTDAEVVHAAHTHDPVLLAVGYSASSMWTANAATVSPSADCEDGRLHLTPANLSSTLHRAIEPPSTTRILRAIFSNAAQFTVHDPLLASMSLSDEGAANHTRLTADHSRPGLELFVYGREALNSSVDSPKKFPARQTLESCQAVARRHGLNPDNTIYVQQTPAAIDAGVFHNDVISVGNANVLLCHDQAFVDQPQFLGRMSERFESLFGEQLFVVEFSSSEIPLADVVSSYLFNSQLLSRRDGGMTLVCPMDCKKNEHAFACTQRLIADENPVDSVEFLDLRQSMNNGGGPACLRLRVVLNEAQQQAVHQGVIFTESLYTRLVDWVQTYYREQLSPDDLADPALVAETRAAMTALAGILELPVDVLVDA